MRPPDRRSLSEADAKYSFASSSLYCYVSSRPLLGARFPSGGSLFRIFLTMDLTDLWERHQRRPNVRPATYPTTVTITNTLKVREDSIIVVVSVIENEIATEKTKIARFRKSESGEPRSSVSSSDSETSKIISLSNRARWMAGSSGWGSLELGLDILTWNCAYRCSNRTRIATEINDNVPMARMRWGQSNGRFFRKPTVVCVLLASLVFTVVCCIQEAYVGLFIKSYLDHIARSHFNVVVQEVHGLEYENEKTIGLINACLSPLAIYRISQHKVKPNCEVLTALWAGYCGKLRFGFRLHTHAKLVRSV